MRQHYRAWLISEKRMYEVSTLYFPLPHDKVTKQVELHGKGAVQAFKVDDEVKLLEYTGKPDRNKVEMCEGDRVRTYFPEDTKKDPDVGWIVWDNTKGAWRVQSYSWWCALNEAEFEIIGNIYENKDLLAGERRDDDSTST